MINALLNGCIINLSGHNKAKMNITFDRFAEN